MKNSLFALFFAVLSLGLTVGSAEAARLGGGKSSGMQRQAVTPKPATPAQATPVAPSAPAAAPAAAPKRNWMGPLAGLAAGLGIAALMSHLGLGEGMGNFLMIALLAMAAIFLIKMVLMRKSQSTAAPEPMQYAGAGGSNMAPPPVSAPAYSTALPVAEAARAIPEGFDTEGFLRVAKLNFIRLQASNDAKNLDDIREFVSPEMFAEFKLQMTERTSETQVTDVVTLDAELLEVVTEGTQHIASVRFNGMIREEVGATAVAFAEIWHLSKQVDGSKGWTVSGIQQVA